MLYRILILLLFVAHLSIGDSETQTNWSGGPGTYGPLTCWSGVYCSGSGANPYKDSGYLILARTAVIDPVEHVIGSGMSHMIRPCDMNGDGNIDLAATSNGDFVWYENETGQGTTWVENTVRVLGEEYTGCYTADIDSDGDTDYIGTCHPADLLFWAENLNGEGTQWDLHDIAYTASPFGVFAEDIDGDGDIDIISGDFWYGYPYWCENLDGGGTSWTVHSIGDPAYAVISVQAKDFNGDGDTDILAASYGTQYYVYYENDNGTGSSWTSEILAGNVHCTASGDVDVDGDIDVLYVPCSGTKVEWLENLGGNPPSWSGHTIYSPYESHYFHAADLDGDEDIDFLAGYWNDSEIVWFENVDREGLTWQKHKVADIDYGWAYSAGDVNGDGYKEYITSISSTSWWETTRFESTGELVSSALYLGNDPGWGSIDWTSSEPAGTSVTFQVRSCDSPDSTQMGAWSDTLYAPCSLADILDENDSFFQYKVILQSSDSTVTPVLEDVTVTWNPVGIDEGYPSLMEMHPVCPNPSSGFPAVSFSLPVAAAVELTVYDVSGRVLREVPAKEYSSGYHEVQLEDLSPGIYFCRMSAEEFTAAERFAVIR